MVRRREKKGGMRKKWRGREGEKNSSGNPWCWILKKVNWSGWEENLPAGINCGTGRNIIRTYNHFMIGFINPLHKMKPNFYLSQKSITRRKIGARHQVDAIFWLNNPSNKSSLSYYLCMHGWVYLYTTIRHYFGRWWLIQKTQHAENKRLRKLNWKWNICISSLFHPVLRGLVNEKDWF